MKTLEEIKQEYPLHWHVWQNQVEELKELLKNEKVHIGWWTLGMMGTVSHIEGVKKWIC